MLRILIAVFLLFVPDYGNAFQLIKPRPAAGGTCSTTSYLVDWSGARVNNSLSIYDSTRSISTSFAGNGKKLKSVTFKTGTDSLTTTTTATLYINTSRDFSGTNVATATATTPGANETEWTFNFADGPTLTNATTYYIALGPPTVTYGSRWDNTLTTANTAGYYYSTDGLDGPYSTPGAGNNMWIKVAVCED